MCDELPLVRRVVGTKSFELGYALVLIGLLSACSERAPRGGAAVASPNAGGSAISIDGVFGDWRDREVLLDDSGDAPEAELDLGVLQMQSDARFVHLLIGLGREVNVQRLDGTLELVLDGDGDPETGKQHHGMPGVDLIIRFSPENPERPGDDHMGASIVSTTYQPSENSEFIHHSAIGFLAAPTHASERIECRFNRDAILPGTPPLFRGESVSMKLVLIEANRRLSDETDVVSLTMPLAATTPAVPAGLADRLPPKADGAFRVLTWNVLNGSIFKKPDLYTRMLEALDPDIALFEELGEDSARALEAFFVGRLSREGEPWQVLFGKGGGPLRCAIASRFPIEPVTSLEWIPYPNRADRSVRTTGGSVAIGERRVLVAPVHLKCCGRIDSWEDERRVEEVSLLNRALAEAMSTASFDAVVVGGDLNLVGGRRPITLLGGKLDLDESDLSILDAYHLHGGENTTWASNRERFVPGRLDYLQYSDSTITAVNAFVFDTADFSDAWLASRSLPREASLQASDHLPVVADFVWGLGGVQE